MARKGPETATAVDVILSEAKELLFLDFIVPGALPRLTLTPRILP